MDMSARKYSKTQGGFTSVDALWGMALGTSPYIYSHHDPINFADPSGYAGTPVGGGGTGTGGTGGPGGTPGTRGKRPAWMPDPFMIDGYSDDEARAITSESRLHRDVRKALWPDQQPQPMAKRAQQRATASAPKPVLPSFFDVLQSPVGSVSSVIWENVVKPAWNSPIARYYVPDVYFYGVGFTGIYGLGAGVSYEANWIMRGRDASIIPVITTTATMGVGTDVPPVSLTVSTIVWLYS